MKRLAAVVTAGLVVVTVLAGCGGGGVTSAAEQVPALSATLDRIDATVAAHRYDAARRQLRALIATTSRARDDGRLDEARATSILAAAGRLLAALPEVAAPTPTTSPTATPTRVTPKPSPTKVDRHDGKGKKGHGKGH